MTANKIMKRKVIFIHIPKTAGTSFSENCYYQYPMLSFFHYLDYRHGDMMEVEDKFRGKDFELLPSWLKIRIQMHAGHMPFGFHEGLNEEYKYVTFLRDPVQRVISNYLHIKYHKHHPQHNTINNERLSLREFVLDDRFQGGRNLMTRVLSGTFRNIQADQELFNKAIQNIVRVNMLIGITEDFENSLALLALELGWEKPLIITRSNKGRLHPSEADMEISEWIAEQNMLDVRLYEEMKAKYNERLESCLKEVLERKSEAVSLGGTVRLQNLIKQRANRGFNWWLDSKFKKEGL
ncbi:MAG: sulfotransferase family 2 domain-containing protein [Cytophagia bacterium]|nr:sulfotransferase family 2 domain-containing protein [Cytophagia bacterium]